MTDNFLKLGEKQWNVPHLPWRKCFVVEPILYRLVNELRAANFDVMGLPVEVIAQAADASFEAASHVEGGLSREEFDALPFGRADLISALSVLARACGINFTLPAVAAD